MYIDADLTHWREHITAPSSIHAISLNRKVSIDDIHNADLDMMPGFRLTWNYSKHLKPEDKYSSLTLTKQFVRFSLKERDMS